mgnify:CR=1 FL=1
MAAKGIEFRFKAVNSARGVMTGVSGDLQKVRKAAESASGEFRRLQQRFNPVAAAADRARREIVDLNRALELGAVDAQQHARQLRALEQAANLGSVANKRFSEALGGSSWRRQVQQAGMQVSDFAVQIAGGQSAILAFTQNAPQFLQNFGAMGGVIAAAVTILGTFAYSAARAGEAVLSFSEQLDKTTGALEEYFSLIRENGGIGAKLFEEAEKSLNFTSEAARDLIMIAKIKAFDSVMSLSDSLVKSVTSASWLKTELEDIGAVIGATNAEIIAANMGGGAGQQVRDLRQALYDLRDANTIDALYESAVRARDIFKENVDVTGSMTAAQKAFWEELSLTIQKLELLGAAQKSVETDVRQTYGYWAEASRVATERLEYERAAAERARKAAFDYYNEMTRVMRAQTQHQKDTRDAAVSAFNSMVSAARNYYAMRIAGENAAAAAAEKGFARSIKAAQQYYRVRIAGDAEARKARQMSAYSGYYTSREQGADSEFWSGTDKGFFGSEWWDANMGGASSGAKGGGGAAAKISEAARELKAFKESLMEAHPALQAMLEGVTEETVKSAQKIKETFDGLQSSISNSMMSAFQGLLDGSKSFAEAALDVLSNIANEIIKIMMTPIFNSWAGGIAGGLMKGFGLASFEGGGMTGAGARAGGLDGKGGRLAMVHPDEEVVDYRNGDGRMTGGVTVVQNIQTPDVQGFRRSRRQLAREARRII